MQNDPKSGWSPAGSQAPNVGTTDDGEVISFKESTARDNDYLLASGDYSNDPKGFDANHDHSYPGGYEDRGAMDKPVNVNDLT